MISELACVSKRKIPLTPVAAKARKGAALSVTVEIPMSVFFI